MPCDGTEIYIHLFVTSALDGDEWSSYALATSPLGKEPGTHWIESGFVSGWEEKDLLAPAVNGTMTSQFSSP